MNCADHMNRASGAQQMVCVDALKKIPVRELREKLLEIRLELEGESQRRRVWDEILRMNKDALTQKMATLKSPEAKHMLRDGIKQLREMVKCHYPNGKIAEMDVIELEKLYDNVLRAGRNAATRKKNSLCQ